VSRKVSRDHQMPLRRRIGILPRRLSQRSVGPMFAAAPVWETSGPGLSSKVTESGVTGEERRGLELVRCNEPGPVRLTATAIPSSRLTHVGVCGWQRSGQMLSWLWQKHSDAPTFASTGNCPFLPSHSVSSA
jgi:hypothetical protein